MYAFNIPYEVVVEISFVALVVSYHCNVLSVDIPKRLIRVNLLFSEVFQVVAVLVLCSSDRPLGIWTMIHINRPWSKDWWQPVDLPTGAVMTLRYPTGDDPAHPYSMTVPRPRPLARTSLRGRIKGSCMWQFILILIIILINILFFFNYLYSTCSAIVAITFFMLIVQLVVGSRKFYLLYM